MLSYLRKHQPVPESPSPNWPDPLKNPPPLLDKNLQVDLSGVYSGDYGLHHYIAIRLYSKMEIDFSDLYQLTLVVNRYQYPTPGMTRALKAEEIFARLDPRSQPH